MWKADVIRRSAAKRIATLMLAATATSAGSTVITEDICVQALMVGGGCVATSVGKKAGFPIKFIEWTTAAVREPNVRFDLLAFAENATVWLLVFWTISGAVGIVIERTRQNREERGHCPNCGYNLTGNVSGVCPECGRRI